MNVKVFFSPRGGCESAIISTIDNAEESIYVQLYYFTSKLLAASLRRAHDRGVTVIVILDKSQITSLYSIADYLQNSGIDVWIDSVHHIAHNKVAIVDGHIVVTGSYNWTKSADQDNAENLLILDNPALAGLYLVNFRKHFRHSTKYEGHKATFRVKEIIDYGKF